jgi:hypothetical protein
MGLDGSPAILNGDWLSERIGQFIFLRDASRCRPSWIISASARQTPARTGVLPKDEPWSIVMCSSPDDALEFNFVRGFLVDRASNRHVVFPGMLAVLPKVNDDAVGPCTMGTFANSLRAFKSGDFHLSPSLDGSYLTVTATKYEWHMERLHSDQFEIIQSAFLNGGALTLRDLDGLCQLDVAVLLEKAAAIMVQDAAVHGSKTTPTPLFAATLIHRLYRYDRSSENEDLIDSLISAVVPFLPPANPDPSIYRPITSLQQIPPEIRLHLFRLLSPVDMKALCRSHKAAYRCLYERQVISRMLDGCEIRNELIKMCSAVTIELFDTIDFSKFYRYETKEALLSAVSGNRFDLAALLLRRKPSRDDIEEGTLGKVLCAAVRTQNDEFFNMLIEIMSHDSVIVSLSECRNGFQYPPALDFIRSLDASELKSLLESLWTDSRKVLIGVLIETLWRELDQDKINCIYETLCKNYVLSREHDRIESLMSKGLFPAGAALKECVEKGHDFLERCAVYLRRWPFDRTAVWLALRRQILDNCQSNTFANAIANFDLFLTHAERPAWIEILGLIRCNYEIDSEMKRRFVAAVEAHYDLSEAESMCTNDEYEILASLYFPRAATKEFLMETVTSFRRSFVGTSVTEPRY